MIKIEASILSADFGRLAEQALEAEAAGADAIQIDVMDGRFVPEITFGTGVVEALRAVVKLPLDVHLMIVEPHLHIERFAGAGADRIFVHQETCPHLHRVLQSIRERNVEAGVTINPGTPLGVLEEVLDITDIVQIMTVNPGWGGQTFIESQLDKIEGLHSTLQRRSLDIPIAVDGGVNTATVPLIVKAGATVLIAGSSVYNKKASVAENITALRQSAKV
jgi:ribulose-phosphate 3-epimerase